MLSTYLYFSVTALHALTTTPYTHVMYIRYLDMFTVCPLWLYRVEYVHGPCAVMGHLYVHCHSMLVVIPTKVAVIASYTCAA